MIRCGTAAPPGQRGFTLIEMILAVVILATGLAVLYRSVIVNMTMITVSSQRQDVAYVFALGELKYPLRDIEDIEEDVPVDKDSSLAEGFVFSRTVDEKPDPEEGVEDDGLYVVRTVVTWADGKEREEIIRYLRDTTQ